MFNLNNLKNICNGKFDVVGKNESKEQIRKHTCNLVTKIESVIRIEPTYIDFDFKIDNSSIKADTLFKLWNLNIIDKKYRLVEGPPYRSQPYVWWYHHWHIVFTNNKDSKDNKDNKGY